MLLTRTEPNFQSNVGPENVRSNYFDTRDIFSLTYHWSTATFIGDKLHVRARQVRSVIGWSILRTGWRARSARQLQFSLTSRTDLVGEYRYRND